MNATNETSSSSAEEEEEPEDLSKSLRYRLVVPLLMAACALTFSMNAVVLAAFPFVRHVSKVSDLA